MTARAVMVCGTTSGAGKSFLVTALARWYARQGLKVAPFKAQNMSNNARVAAGGEMGSAQYFQAIAAHAVPHVRMNPVLLKPERDTQSQVVLLGRRRDDLSRMEWRARARELWPVVRSSLEALIAEHDVVVIEGAGSPAEINLQSTDIVNMRIAAAARAATLLVCDIDRGGAFAHLYGTVQLLPPEHRALIRGFVLNKFRGDPTLLAPAPQMLEERLAIPTLAVLPMWRAHGLPEEDGIFQLDSRDADHEGIDMSAGREGIETSTERADLGKSHGAASARRRTGSASGLAGPPTTIAVIAAPYISNLDEFQPLRRLPGVSLRWARQVESVESADLLILPGSKHVAADLGWLRERGLDAAIARHVSADKPTLAICGGLQMLGVDVRDPDGVEGAARGLGLLPYITEFLRDKHYRHGRYAFESLRGFWSPLSGIDFDGYEIHHGVTHALSRGTPVAGTSRRSAGPRVSSASGRSGTHADGFEHPLCPAILRDLGWQSGSILALYPHGLFESAAVLRALFGRDVPTLDATMDGLADFIDTHFAPGSLSSLLE